MEYRLWAASEWIQHGADFIFQQLTTTEELSEREARALQTGSLCSDIPPLSVKRWDFWKKRFSELAADADKLELSSAITVRISETLKRMDAVTSPEAETSNEADTTTEAVTSPNTLTTTEADTSPETVTSPEAKVNDKSSARKS